MKEIKEIVERILKVTELNQFDTSFAMYLLKDTISKEAKNILAVVEK